jgi:hypothetical protein
VPVTGDQAEPLWLGAGEGPSGMPRPHRRLAAAAAALACAAVVGVPVALVLTAGGGPSPGAGSPPHGHGVGGPAVEQRVVAALGATVASGSFTFTYTYTETSDCTSPTADGTSPTACPRIPALASVITGHGVIDTDPFAMTSISSVPGMGMVPASDDGTDIWEGGGDGPGTPISGFARTIEGALGAEEGGLAVQSLASPTGYLDLDEGEIADGTATDTGTTGGLTVYRITEDHTQDPTAAGLTAQQAATIKTSDAVLAQAGFTATTVYVSVDGSGFIRRTHSVTTFSGGQRVTIVDTFSDFGCAGTALMPDQQGTPTPPAGCVSPDTAAGPSTPTTAPTATTTSTTVVATIAPAAATSPSPMSVVKGSGTSGGGSFTADPVTTTTEVAASG